MTAQADILDQREPIRGPFLAAMGLHAALIGAAVVSSMFTIQHDAFGAKDAGGAAIGIEAVTAIPLPHQGQKNPLANDTQSQVPQQPVTKPQERVKEEKLPPDAVRLKTKNAKKTPAPTPSERQRFRPFNEIEPNQLTSKSAPQVSSPLYAAQPGSGRVGTGANTTLGDRLGGYAAQIQGIIARNWRTSDVDPRIHTAPPVVADFDLMRDGSIKNLRILQRSGVPSLDSSVERAILESKLPPIPAGAGFDRSYATVEFQFELTR